jgi:hypothetical protein
VIFLMVSILPALVLRVLVYGERYSIIDLG